MDELYDAVRRAAPFAELSEDVYWRSSTCWPAATRATRFAELRPRLGLGPLGGHGPRPRGRRAGRHRQCRHDPGPWPVRGLPRGRAAGRRAGRGDGLREPPRRRHPARRVLVADPGHHADRGDRLSGAGRAGPDALLARRQAGTADRAGPRGGRVHAQRRAAAGGDRAARRDVGLDERAAAEPRGLPGGAVDATGAVPDDGRRRRALPRRDRRLADVPPVAVRVALHTPWAMAIEAAAGALGVASRCSGATTASSCGSPSRDRIPVEDLVSTDRIEQRVVAACRRPRCSRGSSGRPPPGRSVAARRPGERTPLWQQRKRSADLLAEAARVPSILLETTRECLRDVFDVPALREVMADLRSRIALVAVDTEHASPFAQSLLFHWIAVYMYEGRRAARGATRRRPRGPRPPPRAAGRRGPPGAARPAGARRGRARAPAARGRPTARSPTTCTTCCGRSASSRDDEVAARRGRADPAELMERLVADGRGDPRPRRRRGARGRRPRTPAASATPSACRSPGLPAAFTAPSDRPLEGLVRRYARTHGPFLASEVAARLGASGTASRRRSWDSRPAGT